MLDVLVELDEAITALSDLELSRGGTPLIGLAPDLLSLELLTVTLHI